MAKPKFHPAWLVLIGLILIRGFAGGGINLTSGLFLAPVSEDLGVGIGNLSLYFSIISIALVLFLPIAGKLINRFDVRIITLVAVVLQALSFAAFGLMKNVYGWYLLAIPQAMGAAVTANLLGPIMVNRWFSKNSGFILGIQMACVGIFGAVLQPFTSGLIAQRGWRSAYIILGLLAFGVMFAATLIFLRNSPKDKGLSPYGHKEDSHTPSPEKQEEAVEVPETTAVHSASFYLLLFFMIAITGVAVFTQHIPTYGRLLGYSLQQTGTAMALIAIGSAVGSVAIGLISDRIGSLKTCYGMIAIGMIAIIGFFASSRGFAVLAISTFLHGLASSGIMVLSPILTLKFYGKTDYEKIYSKVSMGAPLASILLIPAYGFFYDAAKNYTGVLVTMLVLLLIAFLCISLGWKKRCTKAGCPRWREG